MSTPAARHHQPPCIKLCPVGASGVGEQGKDYGSESAIKSGCLGGKGVEERG
jgi:Fe-S-cluster-containing dehydrogenase component